MFYSLIRQSQDTTSPFAVTLPHHRTRPLTLPALHPSRPDPMAQYLFPSLKTDSLRMPTTLN